MSKRILLLTVAVGSLIVMTMFFTSKKDERTQPESFSGKDAAVYADAHLPAPIVEQVEPPLVPLIDDGDELQKEGRDQKVAARLERFIEKTAGITAESVAEERQRLSDGLKQALSKKTAMPEIRENVDANGNAWEELDYGDGVIRYLPAVEPETKL